MTDADVIRIVIPGDPKGSARVTPRTRKGKDGVMIKTTFTPGNTRSMMGMIRMAAVDAMDGRTPFEGPIDLRIAAFRKIPPSWPKRKQAAALAGAIYPTTKPDTTNIQRFEDSLSTIVWRDDAQITDSVIRKRYSDRPRLVIEVRRIEPILD